MNLYIQVITTTRTKEDAEKIAQATVEARLAACAEVSGPFDSTYRWKGQVEKATEWRCVLKTRAAQFDAISEKIASLHSYELPQIVAVDFTHVSTEYAKWIDEQTS